MRDAHVEKAKPDIKKKVLRAMRCFFRDSIPLKKRKDGRNF